MRIALPTFTNAVSHDGADDLTTYSPTSAATMSMYDVTTGRPSKS
jgi:hypothetical protein